MFYYGNEMLDKNTLECRVDTGKWRKQVGGLCGPTINSVIDLKNLKKSSSSSLPHVWFEFFRHIQITKKIRRPIFKV